MAVTEYDDIMDLLLDYEPQELHVIGLVIEGSGNWTPVTVEWPEQCGHEQTLCVDCLDEWMNDWELQAELA